MTIEEAVNISVNRFLAEDIFSEKKRKPTEDKDNTIHKGVIKKKNGQRGNFDYDKDKKSNLLLIMSLFLKKIQLKFSNHVSIEQT